MEPFLVMASEAAGRLVEEARGSVVEVVSGGRGAGAGVLWGQGLVLTNDHVVFGGRRGRRRRGSVLVTLRDGRAFGVEVTERDAGLDLALLRLDDHPDDLPVATVGDSDSLRVGALVFAVGHSWGQTGVATVGVVSGLGRDRNPVRGPFRAARYVRSDVALAPGNSGGPLLNASGEVVGINAMISGGFAFSIPSNDASAWMAASTDLRTRRLGVGVVPAGSSGFGAGLVVAAVEGGGTAAGAGIIVGDVLLGVDDGSAPFGGAGSLRDALARAGDVVRLCVMRAGRVSTVSVELGGAPERVA
jgi:serine protease Do